jgi:hypothetical protein
MRNFAVSNATAHWGKSPTPETWFVFFSLFRPARLDRQGLSSVQLEKKKTMGLVGFQGSRIKHPKKKKKKKNTSSHPHSLLLAATHQFQLSTFM